MDNFTHCKWNCLVGNDHCTSTFSWLILGKEFWLELCFRYAKKSAHTGRPISHLEKPMNSFNCSIKMKKMRRTWMARVKLANLVVFSNRKRDCHVQNIVLWINVALKKTPYQNLEFCLSAAEPNCGFTVILLLTVIYPSWTQSLDPIIIFRKSFHLSSSSGKTLWIFVICHVETNYFIDLFYDKGNTNFYFVMLKSLF